MQLELSSPPSGSQVMPVVVVPVAGVSVCVQGASRRLISRASAHILL